MSKVGQWVMEMQEDATCMTREEFIKTWGAGQVDIWEDIYKEMMEFYGNDEPSEEEINQMYAEYKDGDGQTYLTVDIS